MAYFKNANIGLAVALTIMVTGWLALGRDVTDVEAQLVFAFAMLVAFAVALCLEELDNRRELAERAERERRERGGTD